jgi:hypothetical protein
MSKTYKVYNSVSPDHAALGKRCEAGHLVMEGLAEPSPVVHVDGVTPVFESLGSMACSIFTNFEHFLAQLRVTIFFLLQNTQTGKIYQITITFAIK